MIAYLQIMVIQMNLIFQNDAESKTLRLAFELRYVRKQYADFHSVDASKWVGYTFIDTTFDSLDECVVI